VPDRMDKDSTSIRLVITILNAVFSIMEKTRLRRSPDKTIGAGGPDRQHGTLG
jgi:hypothetical protein